MLTGPERTTERLDDQRPKRQRHLLHPRLLFPDTGGTFCNQTTPQLREYDPTHNC
jgi:hypothetical protein